MSRQEVKIRGLEEQYGFRNKYIKITKKNIIIMQASQEDTFAKAVSAIDKLVQKSKPQTSTAVKSYVVALFTADARNPLRYSGKIGLLHLDYDRLLKIYFLRLYDMDSLQLLLQLQLYYGFGQNYRNHKTPTLYIFDFFEEGVMGFNFRNEEEAKIMAAKIQSVSPKSQQLEELKKQRAHKKNDEKKSNNFFTWVKKKFHSGEQEPQQQQSEVLGVEKQKSISLDPATGGMNLENIPPEWQEIFDTMHLSKDDLKNKEVVHLIFEQTILHQAKKVVEQSPDKINQKQLQMIKQGTKSIISEQDSNSDVQQYKVIEKTDKDAATISLPPPPIGQLPKLEPMISNKTQNRTSTNRADLMAEIRNNQLKLKPVKTTQKGGIALDASSMNRQERKDLAEHLRMKLKRRKLALNRRSASDSDSD